MHNWQRFFLALQDYCLTYQKLNQDQSKWLFIYILQIMETLQSVFRPTNISQSWLSHHLQKDWSLWHRFPPSGAYTCWKQPHTHEGWLRLPGKYLFWVPNQLSSSYWVSFVCYPPSYAWLCSGPYSPLIWSIPLCHSLQVNRSGRWYHFRAAFCSADS